MKTLIIIGVLGLCMSCANAQKLKESEVPAAAKASLLKQYPGAKEIEWTKEDENFEVEFELNKEESTLVIDATGNILETEIEIKASALPNGAQEYVKNTLGGKKIKEASKTTAAKGAVTYEAQVEKTDYIFDANGVFMKKVEKKDDDKNEKED